MYQVYIRESKRCRLCGGVYNHDVWVGAAYSMEIAKEIGKMGLEETINNGRKGEIVLSLADPFAEDLTTPMGEVYDRINRRCKC